MNKGLFSTVLLLLGAMLLSQPALAGVTIDAGTLDSVRNDFLGQINGRSGILLETARLLFGGLMGISIAWLGIKTIFKDGGDVGSIMGQLGYKVAVAVLMMYFLGGWSSSGGTPPILQATDFVVGLAGTISGSTFSTALVLENFVLFTNKVLSTCNAILSTRVASDCGLDAGCQLEAAVARVQVTVFGLASYIFGAILIAIMFVTMVFAAITMIITQIELAMGAIFGIIIFVGFASEWTSNLTSSYIRFLFATGLTLAFTGFFTMLGNNFLADTLISNLQEVNNYIITNGVTGINPPELAYATAADTVSIALGMFVAAVIKACLALYVLKLLLPKAASIAQALVNGATTSGGGDSGQAAAGVATNIASYSARVGGSATSLTASGAGRAAASGAGAVASGVSSFAGGVGRGAASGFNASREAGGGVIRSAAAGAAEGVATGVRSTSFSNKPNK